MQNFNPSLSNIRLAGECEVFNYKTTHSQLEPEKYDKFCMDLKS